MNLERFKSLLSLPAMREVSFIWVSMLFGAIFAFVTQVVLARALPVSHYGALATVMATIALVGPVASLGVGGFWLLLFGREGWQARGWLRPSLHLVSFSSSIVICVLLLWVMFGWTDEVARNVMYWLFPVIFMQALIDLNISRFQLDGNFSVLALWQFLPHIGRAVVAVLAMFLGLDVISVAIGYFITTVILIAFNVFSIFPAYQGKVKLQGHSPAPDDSPQNSTKQKIKMKDVFSGAWPFGLSGILSIFYGKVDIVLLGLLSTSEVAGLYNASISILIAVFLLPDAVTQKYLLPKVQRWAVQDQARFLGVFRFGNGVLLLLGLLTMACVCLSSPFLLPLLFGSAYKQSGTVLFFLSFCIPFRFLAANVGTVLSTGVNMKRKNKYQGVVSVVSVILNLVLIPIIGIYGAVISRIVSELTLLLLYLLGARKHVFGSEAWSGWTVRLRGLDNA